eukprot:7617256-Ditylum_brightwellii.AAC.1
MTLGDVIQNQYNSKTLQICVAQETILSSPDTDVSSFIKCNPNGSISLEKLSSSICDSKYWCSKTDGDQNTPNLASSSPTLAALAPSIRAPSLLLPPDKVNIREVNLWYAPHKSCTNSHYDGNHNILLVMKGTKTVELSPPGAIRGSVIYSEHANHPAVFPSPSVICDDDTLRKINNELERTRECCNTSSIVVSVSEGEALFIPEGWWHRVESSASCLAINFWFDHSHYSVSALTTPSNRHMLPFLAREMAR